MASAVHSLGALIRGRYALQGILGHGAMGVVYRAHDTSTDTLVAVKLLKAEYTGDPELRARFAREVLSTRQVDHPHAVRLLDSGASEDHGPYLVMELLEGVTLDAVIAEGPLGAERATSIALAIADMLVVSHAHGVLHRDLKPENVMLLPTGDVRVLDFGLAWVELADDPEGLQRLTATDMRLGTPTFMAPEYVVDGTLDHRADLYALGVLLFEMLAGRPPWSGSPWRILDQAVNGPTPSLAEAAPDVAPWLTALVGRLMTRDPAGRPGEAAAVAAALRAGPGGASRDVSTLAPPPVSPRPSTGAAGSWGLVAASVLVLAAMVALALLAGCAGKTPHDSATTDEGPGCATGDPTLTLGTGELTYTPLTDGDRVTMVHGGQGGWHVDVAGQVGGTPQTLSLELRLTLESSGEVIAGDQPIDRLALVEYTADTCAGWFAGRRAFIDDRPGTDICDIHTFAEQHATLWARVTDDVSGGQVEATRSVVLTLDPIDVDGCPTGAR